MQSLGHVTGCLILRKVKFPTFSYSRLAEVSLILSQVLISTLCSICRWGFGLSWGASMMDALLLPNTAAHKLARISRWISRSFISSVVSRLWIAANDCTSKAEAAFSMTGDIAPPYTAPFSFKRTAQNLSHRWLVAVLKIKGSCNTQTYVAPCSCRLDMWHYSFILLV